jgi:hypothetical protein
VRRRFLEKLEESLESRRRERVDLVDDVDLAPVVRRVDRTVLEVTNVIDASVRGPVDLDDVWVTLTESLGARDTLEAGIGTREVLAVQGHRHDASGGSLAGAGGSLEDVTSVNPILKDRVYEDSDRVVLADDVGPSPWAVLEC